MPDCPRTRLKTKCYLVSDDEFSYVAIVYATSAYKARYRAYQWPGNGDYETLRAEHRPEWDTSLPTEEALLHDGWWMECFFCFRQIDQYALNDDDEDQPPVRVLEDGRVICSCGSPLRLLEGMVFGSPDRPVYRRQGVADD